MEQQMINEHDYEYRMNQRKNIMNSILDSVGCTPMVRLNKIPQSMGIECEVVVKCEFLNPGGSIKDRIGKNMLLQAEKKGRIKKGDTLIEPTSGNTGLGLALAGAVKGYKTIITMPEKMSNEKADVLTALGAIIYRTPTEAAFDHYDSHLELAKRLNQQIPNSHILNQYTNNDNPQIHYEETGEEIWQQCQGRIDYLVAGAGTGGSITGIGKKLKEMDSNIKIIGIDPVGSILAQPEELNKDTCEQQIVEGIGYDFVPDVLNRQYIDHWIKSNDENTFPMSRRLIEEEGILCGGSCGTALFYALEYAKEHKIEKGKRMVVVLPDGIRNYMTKHLQNEWMVKYHYYPPSHLQLYSNSPLASIPLQQLLIKPITLQPLDTITVAQCKLLFSTENVIPLHNANQFKSCIHKNKFIKMVVKKNLQSTDLIKEKGCIDKDIAIFQHDQITVEQVQKLLEKYESVYIKKEEHYYQITDDDIMGLLKI